MARIGPRGSVPETIVRKLCHALGYRFRLHRRDLPGTPDLVFPSRRKIVLVHGCYWHSHQECRRGRAEPKTDFWRKKLARNVERDGKVERRLAGLGWDVLTVWECQTRNAETLRTTLIDYLGERRRNDIDEATADGT